MRLATIAKPRSIMRVELMKRRGIMPTWPMAMLATQDIMTRVGGNVIARELGEVGAESNARRDP
jgi:hypothetical protein